MINYFVLNIVTSLMRCIEFLLFAAAITSWFGQGSKLYDFLHTLTEPIVFPFRKLTERFDGLRRFPIDIAFLLALLTVELILILLYSL